MRRERRMQEAASEGQERDKARICENKTGLTRLQLCVVSSGMSCDLSKCKWECNLVTVSGPPPLSFSLAPPSPTGFTHWLHPSLTGSTYHSLAPPITHWLHPSLTGSTLHWLAPPFTHCTNCPQPSLTGPPLVL